jgi:hypothetical protein
MMIRERRRGTVALGKHVQYLSKRISVEQQIVDELFWSAQTPEDFIEGARRESLLEHLEGLLEDGEEYYCEF